MLQNAASKRLSSCFSELSLALPSPSCSPPMPSRTRAHASRDTPERVATMSRYQPSPTPWSCAGPGPLKPATLMGANGQLTSRRKPEISHPTGWSSPYATNATLGDSWHQAKHSAPGPGTAPYLGISSMSPAGGLCLGRRSCPFILKMSSSSPLAHRIAYTEGPRCAEYQSTSPVCTSSTTAACQTPLWRLASTASPAAGHAGSSCSSPTRSSPSSAAGSQRSRRTLQAWPSPRSTTVPQTRPPAARGTSTRAPGPAMLRQRPPALILKVVRRSSVQLLGAKCTESANASWTWTSHCQL
mmetsp:Transcript_50323/g.143882  ORF Transcript_50323/g.143882 Transcript_50323/m.143882 type:complete len:299 (-) Transcript_50323:2714-3610(-)